MAPPEFINKGTIMYGPHTGPTIITNLPVEQLYELLTRVGYELLSKSHVKNRMLHAALLELNKEPSIGIILIDGTKEKRYCAVYLHRAL